MSSKTTARKSVLISGASIAGPTLAYWLDRYDFEVTVVERAADIRGGGYPIDVRGTAIDVVERMGLLPQVRAADIDSRSLTFVDAAGLEIGVLSMPELAANETGHDSELPRGELTTLLYGLTRESRVEYRFNDSIEALHDDGDGVDVRFRSGAQARYDVVIGADGLHSNTRRLVFGPQEEFDRDLGFCFNIFTMPNEFGLSHGGIVHIDVGRTAGAYAVRDGKEVSAFLIFTTEAPPFRDYRDVEKQKQRTAQRFDGAGWITPRMVEAMGQADDLFFDTVSQIRMPSWSAGRVVLSGDAAHAPSFLSGQGTSIALVGAYVLAGELASHEHVPDALASYERIVRPFAEANQALAFRAGGPVFLPRTPKELQARLDMLTLLAKGVKPDMSSDLAHGVHRSLRLPDYLRPQD